MSIGLAGDDSVIINSRIFKDLGDDNVAELTFPNPISAVKTGKNGNSVYAYNSSGKQCDFKIKVLRGSADDKFLNNLLTQQLANFSSFILMNGEFIKQIGDGKGSVANDTYILSGGVFEKIPEAKSNVSGDTNQAMTDYVIKFTNAPRAIS